MASLFKIFFISVEQINWVASQNLSLFSWSAIMTVAGNSKGVDLKHVGLFQKNKSEFSPSFSHFSRANCYFLTVLRSVAQSVFNASQGVRDLGLLSWTPLTVFPPQVSCVREEKKKALLLHSWCDLSSWTLSQSSPIITTTVKTCVCPWTTVAWLSVILMIYWYGILLSDIHMQWSPFGI